MIEDFNFFMPTKIIYGKGRIKGIAEYASVYGKKGLIVTDAGLVKTDLIQSILAEFDKKKTSYLVWSDIVPNPRDVDIEKGAAFAVENKVDYLVAVGGGSSIDTAKAMAAIMTNGGKCADWYGDKLKKPIAPLIVVPTTCGTGSEVTHESIVNNTETLVKDCIYGPYVSASIAVIDPDVLIELPPHVMASTGIDALTHAVEAYVCKAANPFTDALALYAIRLIGESLIEGVNSKSDDSLAKMMVASCMAGMAFGNSDVASVHSIAEALGGFYDIPHGVANAMMLPAVSRLSIPGAVKKYADVAAALGINTQGMTDEQAANAGIDLIQQMCDTLKIPKFSEIKKVNPRDFPRLAHTAATAPETADNPVLMGEDDFQKLFEQLYSSQKQ